MGSATPSQSGDNKHKGTAAGGRPGPAPKAKESRCGGPRASEGRNPCTRRSFATKNVFDVLQIYPRVSEDHPGRSWMLQMGSLSPLSTTCTSRLLSFWNGRGS